MVADLWPHPLTAAGRRLVPVAPGSAVADVVRDAGIPGPVEAAVNGVLVPRGRWASVRLAEGDVATIRAAVAGDDPLRTVLQLAVVAAAIAAPYALAGLGATGLTATVGGATVLTWKGALVSAGVMMAGSLVANALAPPRAPDAPEPQRSPATVHSLSGGANRARPGEPMLLVLGRHRAFPDLAAAEYAEFRGNDQYLFQIFDWGLGALEVSDVRIGDTPLEDYQDATAEWALGGTSIAGIFGNVDTEAGGTLDWPKTSEGEYDRDAAAADWIVRETADGATRLDFDFVAQLFRLTNAGDYAEQSAALRIEWRTAADPDADPPVAAGVWAGRDVTLRNARQRPLRHTEIVQGLAAGAYEARVRRAAAPPAASREYASIEWAALRAYQPDATDYAGRNRLGLTIRATGQLSGRLDRLSGIVDQKCPTWDGAAWTAPRATSNPAWIIRWLARGVWIGAGIERRLIAGAGLPADRVDDAALKAFGAFCTAEGLECNRIIDRAEDAMRTLEIVAQCGRATLSWASGKLGVVWDAPDRPVTALITPAVVEAGSYRTEWAGDRLADEIVGRYVDPGHDWQQREVRRVRPGATEIRLSTTIDLPGVTSRAQALDEVTLQAARQRYHRRRHEWLMPLHGIAAARGDVVAVTHSLIDGGVAGRLAEIAANRTDVTLSRPIDPDQEPPTLMLAPPDGGAPIVTSAVRQAPGDGETAEVTLADPLPAAYDGEEPLDWLWRWYGAAGDPRKVRIFGMIPASGGAVRVQALDEVPEYYASLNLPEGAALPTLRRRIPKVTYGVISETLIRAGPGYAVEIELTLTVTGDWRGATVLARVDDAPWREVARLVDGDLEARWIEQPQGLLDVRVLPGSAAAPVGPAWEAPRYEILGKLAPPDPPGNFLFDALADGTRRYRWTPPEDPDLAGVELAYAEAAPGAAAPAWETMTKFHRGYLTADYYETVQPLRAGRYAIAARAVDTGGRVSEEVRIVAEMGPSRTANAVLWECPSATGWPGATAGFEVSQEGTSTLEGLGDYDWDDLTTWDAWLTWAGGSGDDFLREATYAPPPYDLGAELEFGLGWQGEHGGDMTLQYRAGASEAAATAKAWTDYETGSLIEARWIQVRFRLTGDGSERLWLDHLCWSVLAPHEEQRLHDQDTSRWARPSPPAAASGRVVPTTLRRVTDIDVTLQSVGAGWSWSTPQKNPPVIWIFDGDGRRADATVDVVIRGLK